MKTLESKLDSLANVMGVSVPVLASLREFQ